MHNLDWSKLGSNRRQRLAIPAKKRSISLSAAVPGGGGERTFATFDYSRGGIGELRVRHHVDDPSY